MVGREEMYALRPILGSQYDCENFILMLDLFYMRGHGKTRDNNAKMTRRVGRRGWAYSTGARKPLRDRGGVVDGIHAL